MKRIPQARLSKVSLQTDHAQEIELRGVEQDLGLFLYTRPVTQFQRGSK